MNQFVTVIKSMLEEGLPVLNDFILRFLETCRDVLPIAATIVGFQLFVIRRRIAYPKRVASGFFYVLLGIVFFLQGLDMALFPIGNLMAEQLTDPHFLKRESPDLSWQSYYWVYLFAASIGFATALAEPSLLAVALKVENISGGTIRAWGLRLSVALGVGFGIALGVVRIVMGLPIYGFIVGGFLVITLQTRFAPKLILGLAYDLGGVTTSLVTVPMITALGLGVAGAIEGRNAAVDGFGLIAFASVFPVIAVLAYAQLAQWLSDLRRD
jgi:hypothetical protein